MTRWTSRSLSLSISLCAALASACGEPPSDVEPFESSLAPERTVASLTDDEVAAFCTESTSFYEAALPHEEAHRLFCTLMQVTSAPDAATCEQGVVTCLDTPIEITWGCVGGGTRDGCSATVAEIEACTADMVHAYDQEVPMLMTCDVAGDATGIQLAVLSTYPESCQRLEQMCPGIATATRTM